MSASVRVTVTFTMEYSAGNYGDDASLGQIRRQSAEEAEGAARRILHLAMHGEPPNGLKHQPVRLAIQSISEPIVTFKESSRG